MDESVFNQTIDDLLVAIEDAIDASGADIDYETSAGILTLEFENGTKVIINRQVAMLQLWVAAKSGGYHLDFDEAKGWLIGQSEELLQQLLNRVCSEQAGEPVVLAF